MVVKANQGNVKRVATLYRVSTKKQLDRSSTDNGGDIPSQQKACKEFIERQPGWTLVEEYYEKGVSGFKKRAADRDVIQQAKEDALKERFDVLLVFMFDRLGRIDDETPFILQWFVEHGIEMWSVVEGQQKLNEHVDKLINYIRFWQASGESIKTSIRVNEKHSQMVEEGVYRGGSVPYGYKTEKSGTFNKKGKELLKVVIDEEQASVVSLIYDLVDLEGYGQYRIAKQLNEKLIPSPTGKRWTSATVGSILRNPMYKGYMVYGRNTDKEVMSEKPIPELVIIDEAKWTRVRLVCNGRSPEKVKKEKPNFTIKSTKSSLLFVGLARCGHCGSPLTTTYNRKTYKKKDGTVKEFKSAKYRCAGKAQLRVECDGQTLYSPRRIEGVVLDEIFGYLDQLKSIDLTVQIESFRKQNMVDEMKEVRRLQRKTEEADSDLSALTKEVPKSILGKSNFKPELLNALIEEKEKELSELKEQLLKAEESLTAKKIELDEMVEIQKHIPVWREVFEKASIERKKMMLSSIVEGIVIHRDKVEVKLKLHIREFLGTTRNYTTVLNNSNSLIGKLLTYHTSAANA
ncbi:recombinase family protein [Cohnella massiliensis]|uniref:recombinase family protein n=1 Tax=Cohnella massiliensis TaxID=1816691 RepID=UPI0009BB9F62|nr:recombinase family protein [Cohnella massiliensis]